MIPGSFSSGKKQGVSSSPNDMMFLYYLMTFATKCVMPVLPANIDRKRPPQDMLECIGSRFTAAFGLSEEESEACGRMFFAVSEERITAAYCVDRLQHMCSEETKHALISREIPAFLDDGELYNTRAWHVFGDALLTFCDDDHDLAAHVVTPHFLALAKNDSISAGGRLRRLHPDIYVAHPVHSVFRPGLHAAYEYAYEQYRAARKKSSTTKKRGWSVFNRHAKI